MIDQRVQTNDHQRALHELRRTRRGKHKAFTMGFPHWVRTATSITFQRSQICFPTYLQVFKKSTRHFIFIPFAGTQTYLYLKRSCPTSLLRLRCCPECLKMLVSSLQFRERGLRVLDPSSCGPYLNVRLVDESLNPQSSPRKSCVSIVLTAKGWDHRGRRRLGLSLALGHQKPNGQSSRRCVFIPPLKATEIICGFGENTPHVSKLGDAKAARFLGFKKKKKMALTILTLHSNDTRYVRAIYSSAIEFLWPIWRQDLKTTSTVCLLWFWPEKYSCQTTLEKQLFMFL